MDNLLSIVDQAFTVIPNSGRGMADIFTGEALIVAGTCATVALVWFLLTKWLAGADPQGFFVSAIDVLVKMGAALVLLASMNGVPRDFFIAATNEAAARISPTATNPAEILRVTLRTVSTIASGTNKAAATPLHCQLMFSGTSLNPLDWVWDRRPNECKSRDEVGLMDVLKNLPVILVTFVCQALAIIATALMGVAFIAVILMSKVLLEIGLILGPILIGFSVLPYLSYLFDGWLKYMIAAAMTQLVAWVMTVLMMQTVIPAMTGFLRIVNQRTDADTYFANSEVAMLCIAIISSIGAFMMWQVPAIAQGLISGTPRVAATGFGRGAVALAPQRFGNWTRP